jgi:hypothetical protein
LDVHCIMAFESENNLLVFKHTWLDTFDDILLDCGMPAFFYHKKR